MSQAALGRVREVYAVGAAGQQASKVGLAQLAQIVAVQGEDVEGVELHLIVVFSAVQTIEVRDAVYAKQYSLAIEDELVCSDSTRCFDNQRVAACPVIAIAGEQPDALAITLYDQARND